METSAVILVRLPRQPSGGGAVNSLAERQCSTGTCDGKVL
jgi:hypothetical protein